MQSIILNSPISEALKKFIEDQNIEVIGEAVPFATCQILRRELHLARSESLPSHLVQAFPEEDFAVSTICNIRRRYENENVEEEALLFNEAGECAYKIILLEERQR